MGANLTLAGGFADTDRVRIAITGIGGHLGTGVALELDQRPDVEVMGIDIDPPRRFLRNAEFHRVQPQDRRRIRKLLREFQPDAIIHLGVYEPHARSNPQASHDRSLFVTEAILEAAAELPDLASIVVRSGLEVYGRHRNTPMCPDESCEIRPTTRYGRTLAAVEELCRDFERRSDVPVALIRFAPIVGPHIPSPIGRYLRLPVVPVGILPDQPFSLLHSDDVAAFVLAAMDQRAAGPFNAVATGAITGSQAARMGGHLPIPTVGPGWVIARAITGLLGSPLPEHGLELLTRGRTADPTRAREILGVEASFTTTEVIKDLHEWAPVSYLEPNRAA